MSRGVRRTVARKFEPKLTITNRGENTRRAASTSARIEKSSSSPDRVIDRHFSNVFPVKRTRDIDADPREDHYSSQSDAESSVLPVTDARALRDDSDFSPLTSMDSDVGRRGSETG